MTTGAKTCRRCGAPIPAGALDGNCPRCLAVLALSTGAESAGHPPAGNSEGSPAPQRFFGDYEILGELARGGMGVVYRARQTGLNRPVALKMIATGQLATPAQVQRFRLEAEAAARLDHPNIVPIYEVGEHQGQHFYTMKLIERGSLADRSSRLEFHVSDRDAAKLLAKVAHAVHYAHQRGVLHRDLKPTNILLDADGQPHIADFGLAKLFEENASLTQTTAVLGTPAYMAPELATGKAAQATTAADVYSLGIILYELLAGHLPFAADNVPALLRRIVEEEPRAPSQGRKTNRGRSRSGRSFVISHSSFDLDTICLRCLQKDPLRRYTSARSLAEDLERWLAGEPILARPAGSAEKLWRWCRRKPALSASLALLHLVFGLGLTGVVWQWRRAERNAANAHREAERARSAESDATRQLWRSLVEQARAERRTGEEGQRHRALEAVKRAAALQPSLELRNEAVAALVLPDLHFAPVWTIPYTVPVSDFTPSLTHFAVSTASGRMRMFLADDVREEDPFPAVGGGAWAYRLRFSPDGRFVAACYYPTRSNVVWEVATRRPVLSWGPSRVPGEFSRDSQRLLATDDSDRLRCLSVQNGQELWRRQVSPGLWGMHVQPQQTYFACSFEGGRNVELRKLDSGELVRTLTNSSPVGTLTWSPDGQRLLVGVENGRIYEWEVDSKNEPESWKGHDDSIVSLVFAPSGEWLASSAWDHTVRFWTWPGRALAVTAHGYRANAPRFDSDGRRLVGVMSGRVLGQFEVASSVGLRRFPVSLGERRGAWSLDVSPDGKLVVAGYTDGVRLFDFATGRMIAFQAAGQYRSAIFTPDGNGVVTCGLPGLVRWPIERGTSPAEVRFGPRETIRDGLAFVAGSLTADGRWVAAADRPRARVAIYEVNNPTNRFSLANHAEIESAAFSPDGRWLASGTWNGSAIRIWDVPERRLVKELPMGRAWAIFSPDNRLLATSSDRYQVWEVGTWRELYRTPTSSEFVGTSTFSPDGRILATLREGRAVQLLEAASGRVLVDLEAPNAVPISWLRFTADGASLLALEWTRGIQVWDLRRLRTELAALNLDWDAPPFPGEK